MHEYSRAQVFVNNLPYVATTLLGAAVIALGFELTCWAWVGAAAYLAYGVAGPLWIIMLVCPHCAFYATRSCPSGYGAISARLVRKGAEDTFATGFTRHMPVVIPVWIIPLAAGAVALWRRGHVWWLTALLSAFALVAFVVLPLVSRYRSCATCPQRDTCPWMKR